MKLVDASLSRTDRIGEANDAPRTRSASAHTSLPVAPQFLVAAAILGVVVWSYWTTLTDLAERWSYDAQYSHGFLVPAFAAAILWLKRPATIALGKPALIGLGLLVASLLPRWFTGRMDLVSADAVCLLLSLAGATLATGGWRLFRWLWPGILFLGFMIPLPFALEESVAIPLRSLATNVSTYVLQTFGYPAIAEGNIIHIEEVKLGVIDACSGLGMLMTFFALATALAAVLPGPIVDRCVLVASAVPIAVFANVLRITLTGMAYSSFGWQEYQTLIHDTLGWLMMPLALGLLWMEFKFSQRLFLPVEVDPLRIPLTPWMERKESAI